MNGASSAVLTSWQNFYVIVGSSAGALTGLQFVVMALVAQARAARNMRNIHAFGTPIVAHFCTALLISAVMSAPWQSLTSLGLCLGVCGIAGVLYSFRIFWHARRAEYQPDLEDRIWYTVLPFIGHVALVGAATLVWWNTAWFLTAIAIDTLVFLFLGVRNSWDTITYLAVQHGNRSGSE